MDENKLRIEILVLYKTISDIYGEDTAFRLFQEFNLIVLMNSDLREKLK